MVATVRPMAEGAVAPSRAAVATADDMAEAVELETQSLPVESVGMVASTAAEVEAEEAPPTRTKAAAMAAILAEEAAWDRSA